MIKKIFLIAVLLTTVSTYFQLEAAGLDQLENSQQPNSSLEFSFFQKDAGNTKKSHAPKTQSVPLHSSLILIASGIFGLSLLRIRNRP